MDYNLVTGIESCKTMIEEIAPVNLLYYSHIPAAIVALVLGFFVFVKTKRSLNSKILLGIAVVFSLWSVLDLNTWLLAYNSPLLMFSWSLFGFLYLLIYILSLYLVYVFIDKKDVSSAKKLVFGLILLPTLLLMPTKYNLPIFDATNCEASEGVYFTNYYYLAGLLIFFWILIVSIIKAKKANQEDKRKIFFLTAGIEAFLFLFFSTGFLVSYLNEQGIIQNYNWEQYGLFGMPVFIGFLAYLIVKFKTFNIKMIAAQALVAFIVALVGAQYFFTPFTNTTNIILISITVFMSVMLGIWLVNSVKMEVKRKEELEVANEEINKKNVKLNFANEEISQRKEELQKMADSLLITNEKLKVANDKLKQLDEAKSAFFTRASHDLRTPITSILGFVSLIDEGSYGEVNEKQKGALGKTLTVVRRMATLVEDFLTAAKLEAGGMQYQFEKCKVDNICQEIVDTLFPKAQDKGLYLDIKKPQEELPEPTIDGSRIRESISNLVDNAVKYTEKGGVTVKLEQAESSNHKPVAASEPGEKVRAEIVGPVVRITISDTGMGIPQDGIQYLFAKFSRGKGAASVKTTGNGIGLYVCKGMIEDNGGKVWAESEGVGRGSRFIVELPINPPEEVIQKINEAKSK